MTGFTLDDTSKVSVKLSGQTLVLQGGKDSSAGTSSSTAGQVIAYDLSTGQQLWAYDGESGHGAVLARASNDSTLYAVSTGTYSGSPHYVRLDPVTGKSTILGTLSSDADSWLLSSGTLYSLPGGGILTLNGYTSSSIPAIEVYK